MSKKVYLPLPTVTIILNHYKITMRLILCIVLILLGMQLTIARSIESDLMEFIELIPRNRVAFISGRHFLFDAKFRTALSFLRSANFEVLVREEISKSQEIQNVVHYLDREIDLTLIPIKIRRYIIHLQSPQDYGSVRASSSFVQEIADLLPDQEIANLIKKKSSEDREFEELFSKITDFKFKELVFKARNSKSMFKAVDVLRSYQIDLDQILQIAIEKIDKWNKY